MLLFLSVVVAAVDDSVIHDLQETVRAQSLLIAQQAQRLRKLESVLPVENASPVSTASVSPLGEAFADVARRRLAHTAQDLAAGDHSTCCRWTPNGQCGSMDAGLLRKCTALHEYLESKTTTHQFVNLTTCLGVDSSKYSFSFDGHDGNVTLSYDGNAVTSINTPLKCATTLPTLTLQMDTYVQGGLSLAGSLVADDVVTMSGTSFNTLVESVKKLGPYQDPNAWTLESANHWFQATGSTTMPSIERSPSSVSNTYMAAAWTKNPISYMMSLRPEVSSMAHLHLCLSPTQGSCAFSDSFAFWVSAGSITVTTSVRTNCPPAYEGTTHTSGQIFHGTDAETGAGTTAPPDDGIMAQHPAVGDYYAMEINGSSITFTSNRAATTPNGIPFRTCTVPAGTNFYGVINMYTSSQKLGLPFIKYA